jgi:APA family basic amino acid/polyamine antiporter
MSSPESSRCFSDLPRRMLGKKSIAQIQQEAQSLGLKRTLNKWNLLSLGIGCVVGAGIFVMVGEAAGALAGPAVVLSFLLTAIACGLAGLCYAEMASVLPVSGSAYTYAYATLGEFAAWGIGTFLILEYGLAAATVAVGWSGYLVSFLADFGIHIPPQLTAPTGTIVEIGNNETATALFNLPAFLGILAVAAFLIKGMTESSILNNIIVAVKLTVILSFIIIGSFYINFDNLTPFIPAYEPSTNTYGITGIFSAASMIFFAYMGFESVSTAAAEAKNPEQDMPFGMIGTLIVCTLLYMGLAFVLTGIVDYKELIGSAAPLAIAADVMGMPWFKVCIKVGALMGLTSVMLVLLYGMTRILLTISQDGLLPKFLGDINPKTQTPIKNTVLVGVLAAIAAATLPISTLGSLVSMGTLLAFCVVCGSVIYLHYNHKSLHRPFNTPFKPYIPIAGILVCGVLIASMSLETFQHLGVYLIFALGIYFVYGFKRSTLQD